MSQEQAVAGNTVSHMLAQLGRMVVFFCTAGFAYPNVMIEGLDPTALQAATEGDLYKKKKQ